MATKQPGTASDILIRQCSVEPQEREAPARAIHNRATDMDKTKPGQALSGRPIAKKIVAKMKLHWQRKVVNIKKSSLATPWRRSFRRQS